MRAPLKPFSLHPTILVLHLFVLVPGLLVPGPAIADNGNSARAYREGYNLILDENWRAAVSAFEKMADRYPASEWTDDAGFWRCYANRQRGEASADVFNCYEALLEQHPDSEWADDARRAMVSLASKLDREGRSEYQDKVRDFVGDEDMDRQIEVLVALGDIGDERSVEVILKRLDGARDEHLRARIVEILDDLESPRTFEKLKQLIQGDPSTRVRVAAVESLGNHDSPEVVTLLKQVVRDSEQDGAVRGEALAELTHLKDEGMVHFLRELAMGKNDYLAREAIDDLGDGEHEGDQGEETVRILVDLLNQVSQPDRRAGILDSLKDTRLDSAVTVLIKVAKSDPDPRMRRAATKALVRCSFRSLLSGMRLTNVAFPRR